MEGFYTNPSGRQVLQSREPRTAAASSTPTGVKTHITLETHGQSHDHLGWRDLAYGTIRLPDNFRIYGEQTRVLDNIFFNRATNLITTHADGLADMQPCSLEKTVREFSHDFSRACIAGDIASAEKLLAIVESHFERDCIQSTLASIDFSEIHPLSLAVGNGHVDLAIMLLDRNVNLKNVGIYGFSLVFNAVLSRDPMKLLSKLIEKEIDLNHKSDSGTTALYEICITGFNSRPLPISALNFRKQLIRFLKDHGGKITSDCDEDLSELKRSAPELEDILTT